MRDVRGAYTVCAPKTSLQRHGRLAPNEGRVLTTAIPRQGNVRGGGDGDGAGGCAWGCMSGRAKGSKRAEMETKTSRTHRLLWCLLMLGGVPTARRGGTPMLLPPSPSDPLKLREGHF
jgi:hypothetical protein